MDINVRLHKRLSCDSQWAAPLRSQRITANVLKQASIPSNGVPSFVALPLSFLKLFKFPGRTLFPPCMYCMKNMKLLWAYLLRNETACIIPNSSHFCCSKEQEYTYNSYGYSYCTRLLTIIVRKNSFNLGVILYRNIYVTT